MTGRKSSRLRSPTPTCRSPSSRTPAATAEVSTTSPLRTAARWRSRRRAQCSRQPQGRPGRPDPLEPRRRRNRSARRRSSASPASSTTSAATTRRSGRPTSRPLPAFATGPSIPALTSTTTARRARSSTTSASRRAPIPDRIALGFGEAPVRIAPDGDLVVGSGAEAIRQAAPVAFQHAPDGAREPGRVPASPSTPRVAPASRSATTIRARPTGHRPTHPRLLDLPRGR